MSIDTLPEYPNLFELEKEKIDQITEKCRNEKHLDEKENLLDRIREDLLVLEKYGIKKKIFIGIIGI